MLRATPFLMFQGKARAALDFYAATLPDCTVEALTLVPEGEPAAGTVRMATLVVAGQRFRVIDSPIPHAFDFTPSFSIFLDFDDAEALDRTFAALSEGGGVLMPLGNYGFSPRFGWLNDRFGVSWQMNLPG